jgi:hypothetical protein
MKQTIRNLHEALDFILAERDEITEGTFSTRDLARRDWDFLPPAKRSKVRLRQQSRANNFPTDYFPSSTSGGQVKRLPALLFLRRVFSRGFGLPMFPQPSSIVGAMPVGSTTSIRTFAITLMKTRRPLTWNSKHRKFSDLGQKKGPPVDGPLLAE